VLTTPRLKPSEAKPSFRKVSLPPAKLAAHRTDLSALWLSGILTQRGGNKEECRMAPSAAQGAGKRVEIKFLTSICVRVIPRVTARAWRERNPRFCLIGWNPRPFKFFL